VNDERQTIRRTFDTGEAWRTRFAFAYGGSEPKYGLGDYLEEARDWGRDEIDRIKGRPTVGDEATLEYDAVRDLVRALPLGRAARALINGLGANNASQHYLDRLDKLFSNNVPQRIRLTPISQLDPREIARAIVRADISAGNIRTLRSFISQIIERGASFDGALGRFHNTFKSEFAIQWEEVRKVRFPELNEWKDGDYQRIFDALESDTQYWQQALAVRIYFEFKAPLTRIVSASWNQIHDDHWYPYWPDEKEFWFECRENLGETPKRLLDRIKQLGTASFDESRFWFPTKFSRSVDHIRSVEHAWQRALSKCGLSYYPLREFSRSFREFNNPSYYISFLRQYGPTFREISNVAELSKILMRAKKHT
jgi:hypothetical protein